MPSRLRRLLLHGLPKVALSRTVGFLADVPLPRRLRPLLYERFARRYGANVGEMAGELGDYRTLAEFFQRPLRGDVRPLAPGPLVWPCDGRIVSSGPLRGGAVPQVKGITYPLSHLLVDGALAQRLADGSQATIYLAPGDYHRVHSPFAGQVLRHWHLPGTLFPVNAASVRAIPQLFPRNERVVLEYRLTDGRTAALVLVAALNVGDITISRAVPGPVQLGEEVGRFGFGSTVVAVLEKGEPAFPLLPLETRVWMGAAVPADAA